MGYFGSTHTATVAEKHDGFFECAFCGLKKGARARALGTASAESPFFLNQSGARDRAASDASAEAIAHAELMLLLVPCPGCGRRNAEASRAFIRATISKCAMIAVACIALAVFFVALDLTTPATFAGVVALVAPIVHASVRQHTWYAASAGAVEFFEGEAPDRPFTGKPCAVCEKKLLTIAEGERCRLCGVALHLKKCRKKHAREKHDGETGT